MTCVASALVAAAACVPSPPASPTASTVYGELVDAGCLAATDSGLAAVQAEHDTDAAPPWFDCLWDGGSVTACDVPCTTSNPK
jgi:hypothetical protein